MNKIIIITTDSEGAKKTKGEWLPRGTVSIYRGKWAHYIEESYKDKYEQ